MIPLRAVLPAEKAFGTGVGITPRRGVGRSAIPQRRSSIGSSRLAVSPPPRSTLASESASRSDKYGEAVRSATAPRKAAAAAECPLGDRSAPNEIGDTDEPEEDREIERAEEDECDRHPHGQPQVAAQRSALHYGSAVMVDPDPKAAIARTGERLLSLWLGQDVGSWAKHEP